jgi:dihydropteroate synthase
MGTKDTFFYNKSVLNCKGKMLLLDEPLIMGILNVTPDSFYDGNRYKNVTQAVERAGKMLEEGASIIDLGGYSSRPKGAKHVDKQEEMDRVLPAIDAILKAYPAAIISIDTFRSEVARAAVAHGAVIINDISAGGLDDNMFKTVTELKVPYIMMHMRGTPQTMMQLTEYQDLIKEVLFYFSQKVEQLHQLGVNDIVLDPGFGFAKTFEQNYELFEQMDAFNLLNLPVLAGVSRKSMINKVLNTSPDQALNGTTALNMRALQKGANILRVHDVKEAAEAIKIFTFATAAT